MTSGSAKSGARAASKVGLRKDMESGARRQVSGVRWARGCVMREWRVAGLACRQGVFPAETQIRFDGVEVGTTRVDQRVADAAVVGFARESVNVLTDGGAVGGANFLRFDFDALLCLQVLETRGVDGRQIQF